MPGLRRARGCRSRARPLAESEWVCHGFISPFRFADHGGSLTSAIRTQHPCRSAQPFGNLAIPQVSRHPLDPRLCVPALRRVCRFGDEESCRASHRRVKRDRSERCGHLRFYTTNLGRDFRAVKSDHDFLPDDSCSRRSNPVSSLTGTAAAEVHHTVLTFETPLEFPRILTITGGASDSSSGSRPRGRKPGGSGASHPDSVSGDGKQKRSGENRRFVFRVEATFRSAQGWGGEVFASPSRAEVMGRVGDPAKSRGTPADSSIRTNFHCTTAFRSCVMYRVCIVERRGSRDGLLSTLPV